MSVEETELGQLAELWETLSGAEMIQAVAEGRIPEFSEQAAHIGQRITKGEPGRIELEWRPGQNLVNPGGRVHGGYIAMILDNAVCLAGTSTCERFLPMLTLNLNIDYMRGVQAGRTYTVVGTCPHAGRA
ncbi:PaaI family thioesterase, partial [Actinomadura adrarensis]